MKCGAGAMFRLLSKARRSCDLSCPIDPESITRGPLLGPPCKSLKKIKITFLSRSLNRFQLDLVTLSNSI
jgi:hypothetical protein